MYLCGWMEESVEVESVFLLGKPCLGNYHLPKAFGEVPLTAWMAECDITISKPSIMSQELQIVQKIRREEELCCFNETF